MNYINANFVKVKALNKEGLKKRIIFLNFFFFLILSIFRNITWHKLRPTWHLRLCLLIYIYIYTWTELGFEPRGAKV